MNAMRPVSQPNPKLDLSFDRVVTVLAGKM
jgi:hypothetical protein